MQRRDFLKGAAAIGGAAALGGRLVGSGLARASTGSILDSPAGAAPIDHIVVMMMENRSFDHFFGWMPGTDGIQVQTFLDPGGVPHQTQDWPAFRGEGTTDAYRGCGYGDPGHGWNAGRAQRDGGFLAEGSGNDLFALGYYNRDDVSVYADLAQRFTTFDRYHCSLLGPTFPNREYMHSAQSGGIKNNNIPPQEGGDQTLGFTWPTIWDSLIAAGVSCGYYFVDLPAAALWGPRLVPITHHIERYFADCVAGTLPQVVFVDPGFTTGLRTDDHPHADIRAGQRLVYDAFKVFAESSHWQNGVFFLNYDEWGGFFDHVAPPVLPDDRASTDDQENFGQAGFRVPCVMASPYAQAGHVDSTLYDHTSILKLIEWRYLGGASLTARDAAANNIGASLQPAVVDADVDTSALYQVPITSLPCEGDALSGIPGAGDVPLAASSPALPVEEHAFEQLHRTGFYERMGYEPVLSLRWESVLP